MTAVATPPPADAGAGKRANGPATPDARGRARLRSGRLEHTALLSLVAMVTTWVTMLSWKVFTVRPGTFLGPLLALGLVVVGTGIVLRLLRLPGLVVVLAQALAGSAVTLMLISSSAPEGTGFWSGLGQALRGAATSAETYLAPIPTTVDSIDPLLLLGGFACLLLVDVCVATLRRVALAGLPLLAVYTVPISLTGRGVSWWIFVAGAMGFVAMLFLHHRAETTRWGRSLEQEEARGFSLRSDDVGNTAFGLGALATGFALLIPLVVPTLGLSFFSGGLGQGQGGDLEIKNPMTDLRRDLQRDADVPVLTIVTDDPDPSYLRIAALTRFNGDEWSSGDRDVPQDNLARGAMPPLQGVSQSVPRRDYDYQISVRADFKSLWLPTASQISRIMAPGDWRFDDSTMDFLSGDKDDTTASMDYTFTKVGLNPDAVQMAESTGTGGVEPRFTELPSDLPPRVRELARQVAGDAPTKFQRAVALQDWFRYSGGFTYSLDVTNDGDLLSFLSDDVDGRTGYCEQFASAMAAMARTLGIPSRVAVGFLSPRQIGADHWEYSTHDLHAWPELFFPGSGWVRFEPTPAGRAPSVPGYTTVQLPEPTDTPTTAPTQQPSEDVPTRGADAADRGPRDTADDAGTSTFDWRLALGAAGGLLLLALLVSAPRLARRWRRERRWRTLPPPEAAWAELRDTALDLGVRWPEGSSPRQSQEVVAAYFGGEDGDHARPRRGAALAPEAVTSLGRIVRAVELARYARPGSGGTGEFLRADVEACAAAWARGASATTRRRATWWPASLRRRTPRSGGVEKTEVEQRDRVIDHVG